MASLVNDRYMVRIYLAQARLQRHRPQWHATLLRFAAQARRRAMADHLRKQQPDLFQC